LIAKHGKKKAEYRFSPKAVEDMEGIWLYSFTN